MEGTEKAGSSFEYSNANWPLISVVVLNYNGKVQIRNCFPAVLNMHYPHYEIIFVDNGSHDGSLELARQLAENSSHPCLFIEMKENVGYSRGKNAGASNSKGDFIWLLDNDIKPDSDCLSKLVYFMIEHAEIALCGPIQLDYENGKKVVGGGYFMSRLQQPRLFKNVLSRADGYHQVSYITGGVIFVRKSIWDTLGGFEDSGMFFLDDNDLGPRCWIAGWKIALVFNCFVRHFQQSRSSHAYWRWRFRQFAPSTMRSMIRNYTFSSLIPAIPAFLAYTILKAIKNSIYRMDPGILLDCADSFRNMVKGLPESLRQRRRIQSLRTIADDLFFRLRA